MSPCPALRVCKVCTAQGPEKRVRVLANLYSKHVNIYCITQEKYENVFLFNWQSSLVKSHIKLCSILGCCKHLFFLIIIVVLVINKFLRVNLHKRVIVSFTWARLNSCYLHLQSCFLLITLFFLPYHFIN